MLDIVLFQRYYYVYYYKNIILNEAIPSLISGSIDMVVDIFQTGTWYNKRIRERIKQGTFWDPA